MNQSAMLPNLNALRAALDQTPGIRTLMAWRAGQPLIEHYRPDRTAETLEEVNSITKSVVALAIGIALDEGVLPGIDAKLADYLPEVRDPSLDDRVRRITLDHLLCMKAGFAWNPADIDDCVLGACDRFPGANERVRFILSRPFAHEPGERFIYDSHAVHLLSILLQRATGITLERFVAEKIFVPLGIQHWEWIGDESGHTFAARGLMLRTHDLLKLGLLIQARGRWHDVQLVSTRFLHDACRKRSEGGAPHADAGYGYLFWIAPCSRYVFAAGYGEQYLIIAPKQQLVVAATSDIDDVHKGIRTLFESYLLDETAE